MKPVKTQWLQVAERPQLDCRVPDGRCCESRSLLLYTSACLHLGTQHYYTHLQPLRHFDMMNV